MTTTDRDGEQVTHEESAGTGQGAAAGQGVPLEPYIAHPTSRYKSVSAGRWSPTSNTIVGLSAAATMSVNRRII